MKWFGRKAARGTGRPFLLGGLASRFVEEPWPRSYEARVRETYLGNPVAQRAVRLVAECVAWAPVYALRDKEAPPPRFTRSPSPAKAGEELLTPSLLETVTTQLLLHGNAFVRLIEDTGGAPAELFALRPERVTIEADGNGWPVAYRYKVGESVTRIAARDGLGRPGLVHLKAAHPLDDHHGLGCLGAAAGAVAAHNAAAKWNASLLANAARPSGP